MNGQTKPLSEITQQALALLAKELGIADTVRFLNQFTAGYGDYTTERDALFGDLTLDEILSAIRSKPGTEEPNKGMEPTR
jgi:hypothetical protein